MLVVNDDLVAGRGRGRGRGRAHNDVGQRAADVVQRAADVVQRADDAARRDRLSEDLWAREAAEPRQPWPAGHMLQGVDRRRRHGSFPEEADQFQCDCPMWRWFTDGTLAGRWEIDDECTAIELPSMGSLAGRLGARNPADAREELGLVGDDGTCSVGSKYDEIGNEAVVALVRSLATSPACNRIRLLHLSMMGITTSGFIEIARCLALPASFKNLGFLDLDYNDYKSDPEVVSQALVHTLRTPGALPRLRGVNTSLYTESQALYTAVCEAVEPRPPLESRSVEKRPADADEGGADMKKAKGGGHSASSKS